MGFCIVKDIKGRIGIAMGYLFSATAVVRRLLTVFCIVVLCLVGMLASAQESGDGVNVTNKTVLVGLYSQPGFFNVKDNQPVSGYGYDYLQALRQYVPWNYEYSFPKLGWQDAFEQLEQGKIDLIVNVIKTPEREAKLAFSSSSIGTTSTILTVKSGDDRYTIGDYSSLNGIRIGIPKSEVLRKDLNEYAKKHHFTFVPVEYETLSEVLLDLQAGKNIDASVSNSLRVLQNEWVLEQFAPKPFYIAVRKDRPELLAELNFAIEQLKYDDPMLLNALYNSYFGTITADKVQFTLAERDFINRMRKTGRTFTAILNPDRYPLSYYANGTQQGIIKVLADEIIKRTELDVRLLPIKTPEEYQAYSKNPRVDFVFDCRHILREGERKGLVLSVPYISLSAFLLKNKESGDNLKRFALIDNYLIAEQLKEQLAPSTAIKNCRTMEEAIDLVRSGQCDATCLYAAAAEAAVMEDPADRLRAVIIPRDSINLCVGTRDSRNNALISIMNKSVASLSEEYVGSVIHQHQTPKNNKMSLNRLLHQHPFLTLGIPLLLLLILCCFLLRLLKMSKRDVRLATLYRNLPIRFFFADADCNLLLYEYGREMRFNKLKNIKELPDAAMRDTICQLVTDTIATGLPHEELYVDQGRNRSCVACPVSASLFGRPAVIGISRDVTELKQSREEALKKSEFFRLVLQNIGEGVIVTDAQANIVMLSPVAERLLGVRLAEALGKPHTDYYRIADMDGNPVTESILQRSLRLGQVVQQSGYYSLQVEGLESCSISASSSPIVDGQGNCVGAILVFHDVTKELQHVKYVESEVAKWEAAAGIANIYHYAFDPKSGSIRGNWKIEKVWPLRKGRVLTGEEWILPEDYPKWKEKVFAILSGESKGEVVRYRAMDNGRMRYFLGYICGTGEPNGIISGLIQENTSFIEAEREHEDLKSLWSLCLESMPLLLFVKSVDEDFKYVECNDKYSLFMGKSSSEIVGKTDLELLAKPEEADYFAEHDMQAVNSREALSLLENVTDCNGVVRCFQTIKFCTSNHEGKRLLVCMAMDVTEDQARQGEISRLLEDWENVAKVALIGCFRVDNDLNPLTVTNGMTEFWPLNLDGKPLPAEDYLLPGDVAAYYELYASVFSGRLDHASMICRVPKPEGMRYLKLFIKRNAKQTNVVSGLLQDITDSILEQQKRERLLVMWTKAVNTLPVLFLVKNADDDFRYLQVNDNYIKLLGLKPESVVGHLESEFLPRAEEAERNLSEDRFTMQTGERQQFTEELLLPDGSVRFFRSVKVASVDEDGRNILICMSQDVTEEQKLAEARKIVSMSFELLFSSKDIKADLRSILKTVCNSVGFERAYIGCVDEVKGSLFVFTSWVSDGLKSINGNNEYQLQNVTSQPWFISLSQTDLSNSISISLTEPADRQQALNHVPYLLTMAEEHQLHGVNLNYITINDKPWGCVGFLACGHPLRPLSKHQETLLKYTAHIMSLAITRDGVMKQLHKALDDALAADKAKTFFLSSMSHEIRTPLNAVIGFTELLKDDMLDSETRSEYLDSVTQASQALLALLNDILELAKLSSYKADITLAMMDMQSFAQELDSLFQSAAARKGLRLLVSCDNVPQLFVDQAKMRQIMFNLVGNAIKYTKKGSIKVSIGFEPGAEDYGILVLRVSDTGIGIALEDQEKIFEPFVQMSRLRGTSSSGAGTGLGLAIVKKIVSQIGGTLQLESEVGQGTVFTVILPKVYLHQVENKDSSEDAAEDNVVQLVLLKDKPQASDDRPRVLVVDDDEMTLSILARLLELLHIPCATTSSSKEAWEMLHKESFKIVLTDIVMPELTGLQLAQMIRNDPKLACMRVIAISAQVETALFDAKIFDKVLAKPILRDTLADAILRD